MRAPSTTTSAESTDTVGHVIALLVRFPEIATIASHSGAGSIVLSFVVNRRLDRAARETLRDSIVDHIRALSSSVGEEPQTLAVTCELDERLTFVRIARDVKTLSREELALLTTLFAERFGEALLKSPPQDESFEDDALAQDDAVECALEALRDPTHQKSLVGFREEKRVLVYFLKTRKKAKAAAP